MNLLSSSFFWWFRIAFLWKYFWLPVLMYPFIFMSYTVTLALPVFFPRSFCFSGYRVFKASSTNLGSLMYLWIGRIKVNISAALPFTCGFICFQLRYEYSIWPAPPFTSLFADGTDRQIVLQIFTSSTKFDVCYGLVAVSKIRNPCLYINCRRCLYKRLAEIIFTSIVLYS